MSNILSNIDKESLEQVYPYLTKLQHYIENDIEFIWGYPCIYLGEGGGCGSLGGILVSRCVIKEELIKEYGEKRYQEYIQKQKQRLREQGIETRILGNNYVYFKYKEVEFIIKADVCRKTWLVYKKEELDYTELENLFKEWEEEK